MESLECASSLAEAAHQADERPQISSFLSSSSLWSTTTTTKNETTKASTIDSIKALRESLASDVLTSNHGTLEMVASPFDRVSGMQSPFKDCDDKNHKFMQVPLVYCDQTASNRPVQSMEHYMSKVCLPLYGNTHTNTSITGSQSTAFCAEARQIVAEACNAKITGKASLDLVLFAGSGTTSAVELLIDCMGLKHHPHPKGRRPVVFIGPYEHHSNLLPWRESGCDIVMVPECPITHTVDLKALAQLLSNYDNDHDRLKLGTFTAASNVTGKVTDVDALAAVLHQHGALCFIDYATGAPYLSMNMNPPPSSEYPEPSLLAKDAIFLSPHKMIGGIGTPGVLVIKKHLVNQVNAPSKSGGGTVFYVTSTHHRFLSNRVERFEGGTPNIPGILRTGLTFLLKRKTEEHYQHLRQKEGKQHVPPTLTDLEYSTYYKVVTALAQRAPNLVLLGDGSPSTPHLPIFSFLIRCGKRFLHYNYVCALLNDVFGIQSRGGCQCSGPYSQRLLGLTTTTDVPNEHNHQVEHVLVHCKERAELLRPGFTRLSLPFKGLRDEEVDYVLDALTWVARHGWILLPQYRCNHRTGEWRHYHRQGKPLGGERKWLSHYDNHEVPTTTMTEARLGNQDVGTILQQARANADILLQEAKTDQRSIAQALKMNNGGDGHDDDDALLEELRWFVYPKECATWLSISATEDGVPPDTFSSELLGALQPLAVDASRLVEYNTVSQKMNSTPETTLMTTTSIIHANTNHNYKSKDHSCTSKSAETPTTPTIDSIVLFRDGEHTGEAPLAEVEAGIDDGELSERCQIFNPVTGDWTSIEAFRTPQPKEFGNVKDEKNQKKKPARDKSQWGKSQEVAVVVKSKPTPEAAVTDPTAAPPALKKKRGKGLKPPPKMMRMITQALIQWDMIQEGDRLLLGLSGGKDSLCLLHCLLDFQRKLPIKFEIEVCTIDPMTPSFDPSPLIPYVESLGLKYHYIKDDIVERANKSGRDGSTVSSLCAFCARMKRGNLYTCARRNNCNKLVLAQHLDDCAESFFMSVMHNGFLRTMKAHYEINAGDLSVIRPMVYCRESLMTEFAKAANLPVINENCPACFEEPKERARIKKLLSREETLFPNFYDNIRRSLIPLLHEDATAILRCYTEEAVAKSRKENHKCVVPKRGWGIKNGGRGDDSNEEKKEVDNTRLVEGDDEEQQQRKRPKLLLLSDASDEDLLMEIARRKAEKFRLSGANKRGSDGGGDDDDDPTGQVCSLNGGPGSIPCRELME